MKNIINKIFSIIIVLSLSGCGLNSATTQTTKKEKSHNHDKIALQEDVITVEYGHVININDIYSLLSYHQKPNSVDLVIPESVETGKDYYAVGVYDGQLDVDGTYK